MHKGEGEHRAFQPAPSSAHW